LSQEGSEDHGGDDFFLRLMNELRLRMVQSDVDCGGGDDDDHLEVYGKANCFERAIKVRRSFE